MHMGYSHCRLKVRLWSGTSSRANCARNCVASAASRSPLCNLVTCWNIKSYVLTSVWFRFHWFLLPLCWLRFNLLVLLQWIRRSSCEKKNVVTTGNDLVAAILVLPTALVDILKLAVLVDIFCGKERQIISNRRMGSPWFAHRTATKSLRWPTFPQNKLWLMWVLLAR